MEPSQTDPLALASLVLGLCSWMIACCGGLIFPLIGFVSMPCALIGIVLGGMSTQRIRRDPEQWSGKPLAISGIVINLSLLLLLLVMTGLVMAGIGFALVDELM